MAKEEVMIKDKVANRRLEITRGIKEGAAGVDRNYEDDKFHGVIRGIAVMTKGNIQDCRGWVIDDITLEQIISSGKMHEHGLKSRFGHPNMSVTALGTFLGRAKNFSKDGDVARADLYISKTAYDTPNGDLASYVLNLAQKDPDAFGTSVVLGDFELEDQPLSKKKKDEGRELPPLLRIKSLRSVDTVDSPAANNGMFGAFFNESIELSAKATEFLDNLLSSPDALEKVIDFLERYKVNRVDIDGGKQVKTDLKAGKNQEVVEMGIELKDLTLEQLKQERPELVSGLEKAAAQGERTRVLEIVKAGQNEFSGMGMEKNIEEAIEEGQDLDAALAAMRGKRLNDLKEEGKGGPGPELEDQQQGAGHLSKAKEYQKEHNCTLAAALIATAEPRKE